jgi:hypothetical protein
MVGHFARHGLRMKPIPFRSVAWVQQTGENQSASEGTRTGLPLCSWFVEEFGLTQLTPDELASVTVADRLMETIDCAKSWLGFQRQRNQFIDFPNVAGSQRPGT